MVRSLSSLQRAGVIARDGEVGTLQDVFFEDERWTVRYLVVRASDEARKDPILISPVAVETIGDDTTLRLVLTRRQVHAAPGLELDRPVDVEMERAYYDYHGWPYYWQGSELWGHWGSPSELRGEPVGEAAGSRPVPLASESELLPAPGEQAEWEDEAAPADTHLRSVQDVHGYRLEARDGHIGHVMDFLLDDHSWKIVCVAIDTSDWWFGKKVAVPTRAFHRIEWETRTVYVDLDREQVRAAGEYDAEHPRCDEA